MRKGENGPEAGSAVKVTRIARTGANQWHQKCVTGNAGEVQAQKEDRRGPKVGHNLARMLLLEACGLDRSLEKGVTTDGTQEEAKIRLKEKKKREAGKGASVRRRMISTKTSYGGHISELTGFSKKGLGKTGHAKKSCHTLSSLGGGNVLDAKKGTEAAWQVAAG